MSVPQPKTRDRQDPDGREAKESPAAQSRGDVITTRWTTAGRAVAIVIATVLAVEFLRLAKPVLLPLIAGLFLAILARPLHVRVRDSLPGRVRWLGLVAAMLVIIAGVAVFGGALALSGRAVADEFRSRRPQIEAQLQRARAAVERAGVPFPQGGSAGSPRGGAAEGSEGAVGLPTPSADSAGARGGGADSGLATRVLRSLAEGLVGLGLALAFAALGLAEAGEVRRRIAHLGREGVGAQRALAAIDEAAPAFRRYVWVKSLTSAITGIATWLAALAFGLPLAWVWGFLAFLLEYVPTVGSLLAVVPPTLMALAEGGPGRAAAVLIVIGTLQVILGNVVDPRLEGKLMDVSPFGVLLSIVFWGWLWGAVGALLAVPLTIAIVIACRHIPGARGFATVVAGDGVPERPPPDAIVTRKDPRRVEK